MASDAIIDTGRNYGVNTPGFAVDWRPGVNPSDWIFTDTYAWPVPHGPQPVSLMPAVLKEEWETTQADTGPYARYRADHFNFPAGKVQEYSRLHPKDWVLRTVYDPNGVLITSKWMVEQGEGISLNFVASGRQLSNAAICHIEFGHTVPSKKYNLNIYENGHAFLGRGAGINPEDQLADGYIVPRHDGSIIGRWIKLFIYFYGRNRLLIASSTGNSFIWEDTTVSREPETAASIGAYRVSETALAGGQAQAYSVYRAGTGFQLQSAVAVPQVFRPIAKTLFPLSQTAPVAITANTAMHMQLRRLPYGGSLVSGYAHGTMAAKLPSITSAYSNQKIGGPPLEGDLPNLFHLPTFDPAPGRSLTSTDVTNNVGDSLTDSPGQPFRLKLAKKVEQSKKISLTPTVRLSRPAAKDGDENKSPTFYRHEASYNPTLSIKPDAGNSIKGDITRFTHNHDKDGTSGSLELRNAQNHVPFKRAFNIPFQWTEAGSVFVQGYLSDPKVKSTVLDQRITLTLTDEMKLLKTQYLGDMNRLDGLAVDEAVKQVLISLGFPDDGSMWVIDPVDVITDRHGKILKKTSKVSKAEADDEPTNLSDVLKTGEDWLKYLIETYTSCAHYPYQWVMGWAPYLDVGTGLFKYKFFFRNPDILNALPPTKTFYMTREQAIEMVPLDADHYQLAYRDIYTEAESESVEPEFNALLVIGVAQTYDPDGGQSEKTKTTDLPDGTLIKVYKEDPLSIQADIPLADRKANYLGWRQLCVIYDGALNTNPLVTAACGKIFMRGSQARERKTIKAEWEPAVRVWDEVYTYQIKNNVWVPSSPNDYELVKWNVTGFDVDHLLETTDTDSPIRNRPATYYLERGLV